MLGSNDLLQHPERTAWEIAAQMGTFLTQLPAVPLLLIAPPPMQRGLWVREERLLEGSAQLGTALAGLAKDLGVSFADAADWDIPLAFDGVHFTEEGHRRFAAGVEPALCAVRGA